MATIDQIPTDLTLEIGETLSPEGFLAATRAFFGYVSEIANEIEPGGQKLQWTVFVREGSALLGLQPNPGAPPEVVQSVYAKAEMGIDRLAKGQLEESHLSEPALRHLRALSALTEGPNDRLVSFRLWVKRRPIELTAEIARIIDDDWRVDYRDYGTIEGRLEAIQDNDGRLQLRVRDAALRHIVKCYVSDDMLDGIFLKFRKRVEVTGLIHYRKNGTPISINAVHIEALPDDNDLPTADEVRGLLRVGDGGRADLLG